MFISYVMCVNSLKDMSVYAYVSVRSNYWCVLAGSVREHVCEEHAGHSGGSSSCNELY